MKKENKVFIGHILDLIFRIRSHTVDLNETEFMNSFMVQDAVIRNFEIILEGANLLKLLPVLYFENLLPAKMQG